MNSILTLKQITNINLNTTQDKHHYYSSHKLLLSIVPLTQSALAIRIKFRHKVKANSLAWCLLTIITSKVLHSCLMQQTPYRWEQLISKIKLWLTMLVCIQATSSEIALMKSRNRTVSRVTWICQNRRVKDQWPHLPHKTCKKVHSHHNHWIWDSAFTRTQVSPAIKTYLTRICHFQINHSQE